MRGIKYSVDKTKATISLLKSYYEREAVFAAAHSITDRCYVTINAPEEGMVDVTFTVKEPSGDDIQLLTEDCRKFRNKVLDEQVRLDLEKRYGHLRDMIFQQAFAPISTKKLAEKLKDNGYGG